MCSSGAVRRELGREEVSREGGGEQAMEEGSRNGGRSRAWRRGSGHGGREQAWRKGVGREEGSGQKWLWRICSSRLTFQREKGFNGVEVGLDTLCLCSLVYLMNQ